MTSSLPDRQPRPRRRTAFWALQLGAALLFALFVALGVWQIERLAWKEDLIARITARQAAEPVPAPPSARWDAVNKADDEYRRVTVRGAFDHARETLVGASTELGSGYWVLTPLRTTHGDWVLINRGFVPPELKSRDARRATEAQGEVGVTGLLRLTEPVGRLLQKNDPAAGRWYSRDVEAIARARQLDAPVAPYFIDESAPPRLVDPAADWPRAGLTVIRFSNNHRSYALTWFAMALGMVAIAVFLWREERRRASRPHDDRDGDHDGDHEDEGHRAAEPS